MSSIKEKRDSLERFIREQTIGPGACGYRYVDLHDQSIIDKDLKNENPIDYESEVIDSVPSIYYSTAMLFPLDKSKENRYGENSQSQGETKSNRQDDIDEENDSSNNDKLTDEDDIIDISQKFPHSMGITICLENEAFEDKYFEFEIYCRYYNKISIKENRLNNRFGLLCEVNDPSDFLDFIEKYRFNISKDLDSSDNIDTESSQKSKGFRIIPKGENHFLLSPLITDKKFWEYIKEVREEITKEILTKIKRTTEYESVKFNEKTGLTGLRKRIYRDLKYKIEGKNRQRELYDITQEIERVESYLDHLRDAWDILEKSGYGLWKSSIVIRKVKISDLKLPIKHRVKLMYNKPFDNEIIVHDNYNQLITSNNGLRDLFRFNLDESKENFASLSGNIQLTRDSRRDEGKTFLKVQLVNTSTPFNNDGGNKSYYSTANERVNQKMFFGVKVKINNEYISSHDNEIFSPSDAHDDSEESVNQLLYREYKTFGVGHGCSVKWNEQSNSVETEYLPSFDVPDIDPIPRKKNQNGGLRQDPFFFDQATFLQFKWLSLFSRTSDEEILEGLFKFIEGYRSWIYSKERAIEKENSFAKVASQELQKCKEDYYRIRKNIEIFLPGRENAKKMHSFRLMNSVMFMQLWHSKESIDAISILKDSSSQTFDRNFYQERNDELFEKGEPASWRPFQLAFILLNLDGIFKAEDDPKWKKRNELVDLVWFPTGGGKTEAYLGIIALTIISRRIFEPLNGGGTAVIMRYTLRLLTLQQFQRATLLIMALELCRRWGYYDLGEEPICIGFWVGDGSIPNKTSDLKEEFDKLNNKRSDHRIPFSKCPWCNSNLEGKQDQLEPSVYYNKKIHLKCTNSNCVFFYPTRKSSRRQNHGPIPLCLSDEIIYQHPPALLFGTVDKFAQLAHKVTDDKKSIEKDSRRLFGVGCWEPGKPKNGYLTPDLIIQDELHLLNGPLGSAVAQFEAAIDQLCRRQNGTRAKVISSTATTKNTDFQIDALFDRKVNVFPKRGIDCDDSFYSYYRREYNKDGIPSFKSNRRYLGVMATGQGSTWMQIHLAAIILTHRALFELKQMKNSSPIEPQSYLENNVEKIMDYYHTIVSYFNSTKEVAKTHAQLGSFLIRVIRRVFNRVIRPQKLMQFLYAYDSPISGELTGRLSGTEVKNTLQKVGSNWKFSNRFKALREEKFIDVPEFVVATNMISVGVDIKRFNTMIVNSMPRNVAEYIQATSRVARDQLGLVVTIHNPYRSRDISHYERFVQFHQKMYKHVEPISITPFTKKAVDKYMGLYLSTMIRHGKLNIHEFIDRKDAVKFKQEHIDRITEDAVKYFDNRMAKANDSYLAKRILNEMIVKYIRNWIKEALEDWNSECERSNKDSETIVFTGAQKKHKQTQLYVKLHDQNAHSKKWIIPQSMRVIEPDAAIKVEKF